MMKKSQLFKVISLITGLSLTHVYNLVSGKREVSWDVAETLLAKTGISASWWMRASKEEVSRTLSDQKTWEYAERRAASQDNSP
jgi:hypothetical protein